jgi:hypothetical protein
VNKSQANHLIKTAQDLSWSQLCILAVVKKKNLFQLKQGDYRDGNITKIQIFLASQAADLYHKGLINFSGEALLGLSDVNPGKMEIQGVGLYIYQLMELVEIPDSDLKDIVEAFS